VIPEFVDANIFIYAVDHGAVGKQTRAIELIERLVQDRSGAISTQVLAEFFSPLREESTCRAKKQKK